MVEILEVVKTIGPAIGILVWLVWKLWNECGEKEDKIEELHSRLLQETKQDNLTNIRMIIAQFKSEGLAQSYTEFLSKQADELKEEIDAMKRK